MRKTVLITLIFTLTFGIQPANAGLFDWLWPKQKKTEACEQKNPQTKEQTTPPSDENLKKQAKKKKSRLRFTENIGQMDEAVRYHVNDMQANHYFLNNEIRTVVTQQTKSTRQDMERKRGKPEKRGPHSGQKEREEPEEEVTTFVYGLKFLGTSGPKEYLGLQPEIEKTVGKITHIKGSGTYSNIPQYGQLQYTALWEGIDIDFYETQGHLKYDFIVQPDADPAQIQLEMNGVSNLKVNARTGELEFTTPLGELKKGIPYTYQVINDKEVEVSAKYLIKNGVISFKLGKYNKDYPLIIDPIALKFATFLGGNTDADDLNSIYVHPTSGNIYMAGNTLSTSFAGVTGAAINNPAKRDGFITCMSPDGSTILWTTIIGGDEDNDYLYYVYASDDENDVFVSGNSRSDDYPVNGVLAPYSTVLAGGNKSQVISRLSGNGTVLEYSTFFPINSFSVERFVVVGDIVYGSNYYDLGDHNSYPIPVPAGAYISTPPSNNSDGQLFYGINTALSGVASYQYGTYYYDTTPDAYTYLEFTRARADAAGNIYFGGYFDIGQSTNGPTDALFTPDAIHKVADIQNIVGPGGTYGTAGWVAQFNPTLSSLIYATPIAPILDTDGYNEIGQYNLTNFDVSDNGDIYFTSIDVKYDVLDSSELVVAPTNNYTNLQPLEIFNGELLHNTASKISAANRSQYEYITTATASYAYNSPSPGGVVDKKGRLHWVYDYDFAAYGAELNALSTTGAVQSSHAGDDISSQYVLLSPTGKMEYATIIGQSIDFSSNGDSYPYTSFVTEDCKFYIAGFVEYDAQKTFPVTPSYWDADAGQQVFVHDATPASHDEAWLTVFHEPEPSSNVINDFAAGNNEFCIDALIYQNPNFGPIMGDPIGYQSGDGSVANHNLPDIRPAGFTQAHPTPAATEGYQWQISYDNGATWTDVPSSGDLPVYKPESESVAGTVQYRRAFFYDCCANEPLYSNVATAIIADNFTLEAQAPTDPVYFCSGIVEDFSFPIAGATGNISWQWYDGFAPIDNTIIDPASGSGVLPANFTAGIPATATAGGFYRLVITDDSGCSVETAVTIIPLTSPAGTGPQMAICPGSGSNDVTLGPSTPNPDFEYSWTGPGGFTSSDPNPVVTVDGTYNLQVKLVGTPDFCVGGETTVDVFPLVAHDSILITIADSDFCQSDDPAGIGLAGDAPAGYVFQWSPGNNLDDLTAFNPTFDPGILSFGSPVSTATYTFTALRLSDGCIFETTTTVTNTALALANAGDDRGPICNNSTITGKASTTGDYFEWEAIATSHPDGLTTLITDAEYTIDGNQANLGINKFMEVTAPLIGDGSTCYTIDYELRASFLPLLNDCMSRDTVTVTVCCVGAAGCPPINATLTGTDGACGSSENIISVSETPGFAYVWTTYSVDGVVQPDPTEPSGLFEVNAGVSGAALSSNGPHPTQVIANIDDPAWGWAGANFVVYEVTGTGIVNGEVVECFDRLQVFSGQSATPVIGVKENIGVCTAQDPGSLLTGNGVNLPYQISGIDYTAAPNSGLLWDWAELGGETTSILGGGDTPFPTLEPASTQTYVVMVTDPLSGCVALDTFTVDAVVIPANAGEDVTGICSGALIQLGTAPQAGYSYEWSPASGLNFPIGTPNNTAAQPYLVVPGGVAVEYSVIVTNTETGCTATDTLLITPETNVTTPPAAASYTSCPGGEFTIGATYTPADGIDFSWSAGAGGDLSWLSSTSVNQPVATLPDNFTGPATFTLTVTNGSCGSASTDYIITNDPADVDLGPDVVAVCQAPYIEIGPATATPGYAFIWSPSTGLYTDAAGTTAYNGGNSSSYQTLYARPLVTTEYTIIASNSSTGCLFTDKITVDPPASIDVNAGDDVAYCPGESSVSIGQSGGGTMTWTATGYNSNPNGTPATPTAGEVTTMEGYLSALSGTTVDFSQSPAEPGVYVYTITADYGGGCVASDEVQVIVPDIPASLSGGSTVMCEGDDVQLGTTGVAGVTYSWSILNATALSGTISDPTSATPTIDPQETTSYSLTFTDASSGCEITEVITVVVVESPNITGGTLGPLCSPPPAQDLTAVVSGYAGLTTAVWYRDFVGGPVELSPTAVTPTQTTDYYLVGYNDDSCSTEVLVTVTVDAPLAPDVLPVVTGECPTATIDLADYQGSPSDAANTLEWHTDNTTNPATIITNTVVGAGTYYIFETSPNGCFSASDFLLVQTIECACLVPASPEIAVTNNVCAPETPGIFSVTTACDTGSTLEWSTDNGTTWSTTAPVYDANVITAIARCVNDIDDTCISIESMPVTSAPNNCCPDPNCFGIGIQQN